MIYKFSVTINDKKSSVSPRNGLDINELGILIRKLKKAIDAGDGSFCTLYKISNHGYTPNFLTDSKKQYENFVSVHRNIYERTLDDLRPSEAGYAQTLKKVLTHGKYIESFGVRNKPIVKISPKEIDRIVDTYNSITNVVGVVTEMGSIDLKKKTHIYLDGQDYKIYTTVDQDDILKEFYRKSKVTLKIKQKKSIKSNRIISASLIKIIPKTKGNFVDNIKLLSKDDLSFLDNLNTHEDILNLIRS